MSFYIKDRDGTDGIRIDRVSFPIGERVLCGTCRGLVPPGIRRHTWSINSNRLQSWRKPIMFRSIFNMIRQSFENWISFLFQLIYNVDRNKSSISRNRFRIFIPVDITLISINLICLGYLSTRIIGHLFLRIELSFLST